MENFEAQNDRRDPFRPAGSGIAMRPDAFAPGLKRGRIPGAPIETGARREPETSTPRRSTPLAPRLRAWGVSATAMAQRSWRAFDAPGKARLIGSSATAAAVQSRIAASRLWRGGKGVASFLSADALVLVQQTFGQYRLWSRAKEEEVDQLAEGARHAVVTNRFRTLAPLNGEEQQRIKELSFADRMMHQSGTDIAIEGEGRSTPRMIVSGWAARLRVAGGRRQILALYLPGDIVAIRPRGETRPSSTLTALNVVETVEADRLLDMACDARRYPGIAEAVERAAAQEMSFADNQVWRLGGMGETRRVAHLMAELGWRLSVTGLASPGVFPMPLTCETIGDMLAMKPQRVRATLNRLRAMGLYSSRYCRVSVPDAVKSELFSGFRAPETVEVAHRRERAARIALVAAE